MADARTPIDFRPTLDWIVVDMAGDLKTASGILLVQDADPYSPRAATVVAVGPGRSTEYGATIRPDVKEGDTVLVQASVGVKHKVAGHEYRFVRGHDVLGIVG